MRTALSGASKGHEVYGSDYRDGPARRQESTCRVGHDLIPTDCVAAVLKKVLPDDGEHARFDEGYQFGNLMRSASWP